MLNTECKICRPRNTIIQKYEIFLKIETFMKIEKVKIALLLFESFLLKTYVSPMLLGSLHVHLLIGLKFDLLLVIVNIFKNYNDHFDE